MVSQYKQVVSHTRRKRRRYESDREKATRRRMKERKNGRMSGKVCESVQEYLEILQTENKSKTSYPGLSFAVHVLYFSVFHIFFGYFSLISSDFKWQLTAVYLYSLFFCSSLCCYMLFFSIEHAHFRRAYVDLYQMYISITVSVHVCGCDAHEKAPSLLGKLELNFTLHKIQ